MKPIKILIVILSICFLLCIIVLAYLLGGFHEILCPASCDVHCICDVSVDCCCPTEASTPSQTGGPTVTVSPTPIRSETRAWPSSTLPATRVLRTATPTFTDAPTITPYVVPSRTPTYHYIPTPTRPVLTPTVQHTRTALPTSTIELIFCHCEQGEGEGAEGRKNCHPVKYTHGHSQHEWDYWSTDGTCDGWNH